ncbi:MAG: hypothetical protein NT124_03535 [Candidatus Dependentiae bacterium]|nr:hypothetical protein [Candidatus Dependentiae bacterium]
MISYPFKATLAFLLSACHFAANSSTMPKSSLLDSTTHYDLDLLSNTGPTVSNAINKTITNGGKKALDELLLNPSDNSDELIARQASIKFFLERQALTAALKDQLLIAAHNESSLEEPSDELGKKSFERVYFSSSRFKHLNTSTYGLDLAYVMSICATCAPLFEHALMHILIDLFDKRKEPNLLPAAPCNHGGPCNNDHNHGHQHDAPRSACPVPHKESTSPHIYYMLQATHWGLHLPRLYSMACDVKHQAEMVKYVQHRMIKVADYIHAAESIYTLLEKNKADQINFKPLTDLHHFFGKHQTCSQDFKQLSTLLSKQTFTGHASLFNHVGNVLAALALFNKVEKECAAITKAISEIDVYLNIAELCAQQTSQAPWCFVTLSNHENPHIQLRNVRHLFVPNSRPLNFSSDDGAHTVIMGDNGSGKSTYTFSIGHAVILAQTFGIAPAESCVLTPFSHICTFRLIQDNMPEGISRFYAECARVQKIIDIIQSNSKRALVLFDEPFTYTTAQKGSVRLQTMLSDLSMSRKTISLVVTHYHDIGATKEGSWNKVYLGAR